MVLPVTGVASSLPSIGGIGGSATSAGPEAAKSFGDLVSGGLENLAETQATADGLAQAAATGDLTDLHDYMIASSQAQLTTELTVTVRNKAVDAFNEIMRMQI